MIGRLIKVLAFILRCSFNKGRNPRVSKGVKFKSQIPYALPYGRVSAYNGKILIYSREIQIYNTPHRFLRSNENRPRIISLKATNNIAQRESLGNSAEIKPLAEGEQQKQTELFDAFSVAVIRYIESRGFTPGYYLCRLQRLKPNHEIHKKNTKRAIRTASCYFVIIFLF